MQSQHLYDQGRFSDLKNLEKSDIYKVGALIFLGSHKEARWLASQWEGSLSPQDQVFVNFHLGISYTRTSNYKKASELFKDNLKAIQTHDLGMESEFLCYQGLGFFNFFFSRHRQSLKAVYEAHKRLLLLSNKTTKPLYQVLCHDLEGHNLIQRLRVYKGIESLEKARDIAKANDMSAFEKSLTFSLLQFKSQFTEKPQDALRLLQETLEKISPEDDYSRAELVFSISNLMMLMGNFKAAQDFLSNQYKVVYENDNKRQMGQLNFRMTYNLYRQGSFEQALYLAKTARANLKKLTDRGLMSQILGLEIKILRTMGESTEHLLMELKELDSKVDSLLIKRINARTLKEGLSINKGEDRFGDIVEKMQLNPSKDTYEDIVKNKMYGLLGDYFKVSPGSESIVINAPKSHTVVFKKGTIDVIDKPLGALMMKLLLALGRGSASKDDLIKDVWGYSEYDPLRHDHLIYSSITRLRTLLKLDEQQILFDGENYKLTMNLMNFTKPVKSEKTISKNETTNFPSPVITNKYNNIGKDLNFRQINIIKNSQWNEISVKDYAQNFNITTMTALRDLRKLCELNYLKKFGQGRATRYLKNYD